MISILLSFLKSKLAAFGAILVIILAIAIGGPLIFGARWRWLCYLAAAAVLVIFLLYLVIKAWRARRNARLLEGFLKKQADDQLLSARPDVKDELAAIKKKLDRALEILKRSKMARGRRGLEALYVLPWYMIIGPSAAGKSTALRNSGLRFPPVDPDSHDAGKVRGLGGTRNCDWWFSNEGIILDTAGRYTLSAQSAEDREEWGHFLLMLRKARRRTPINGLILAVAVDEVLKTSEDEREELAKTLRSRIDELMLKLEIVFPIYVLFTKCDLIAGFVEFFGNYGRAEREQIWGYTRRFAPSRTPLEEEFAGETSRLAEALRRRCIRQLAGEIRPTQKRGAFLFPLEFDAVRQQLTPFVATLFAPNPYQQNPVVRGFYFTSGTQEGSPIGQIMESMRRDFGLLTRLGAVGQEIGEPKAYFIKDLFGEVILPDESRIIPTTQAWKRLRWLRLAWIGGLAAATVLASSLFFISYQGNRDANDNLAALTDRVVLETRPLSGFSAEGLEALEPLRLALEDAEHGPGLWRRWGLYFGERATAAARSVYFKRYHDLFLEPSARVLEGQLRQAPTPRDDAEMQRFYAVAAPYQMLTAPIESAPRDVPALTALLDSLWTPQAAPAFREGFPLLLDNQINYYWKHRRDQSIRWVRVQGDADLQARIDRIMQDYWNIPRLYATIIDDANSALGGDLTIRDVAPASLLVEGGRISHAFTSEGWKAHVQPRIDTIQREIDASPILKRAIKGTTEEIQEKMTEHYAREFVAGWQSFFRSVRVAPMPDLSAAAEALNEFAGENSPILLALRYAYRQSGLDIEKKWSQSIRTEFAPIGRFIGELKSDAGGDPGQKTYLDLLSALPKTMDETKSALDKEGRCAQQLKRLNSALEQPKRQIRKLMGDASSLAKAASDLLVLPLTAAGGAGSGEVCACLNNQWEASVFSKFEPLGALYPFTLSSDRDASRSDIAQFFGTSSPLTSFHEREGKDAQEAGLPLSGEYQTALQTVQEFQRIVAGQTWVNCRLTASTDYLEGQLSALRLTYGNQRLEFFNGPPTYKDFLWPEVGASGALFKIDPAQGGYAQPLNPPGEWAFLRLFDVARPAGNLLEWTFEVSGGRKVNARLHLSGSDAAFLLSGHFSRFHCPRAICH